MIKICPAILVNKEKDFIYQLNKYTAYFDCIDVDLNIDGDDFLGNTTISPSNAFKFLKHQNNHFNIHLMVSNPIEIINLGFKEKLLPKRFRFFLHQEADFSRVLSKYKHLDFGIVVKAETKLNDVLFYKQFPEIQLMTIITGKQGNPFIPKILNRVEYLRKNGYKGAISLDGSVNLESAKKIRNFDINRVSVGSFFSKAKDLELSKQKLALVLKNLS